jgi:hypothetical protein
MKSTLQFLTPVHIGTGAELDPFGYVIREKTLFLIDLVRWMQSREDPDALARIMDTTSFVDVRTYIANHFNDPAAVTARIPIDSGNLLKDYKKAIAESNPENQVLVSPMPRNEVTGEAYLPGSSLKGAIRTAVANRFVKKANVTAKDVRGRFDYNQKIFGRITEDPMRNLTISDLPLGDRSTAIVEPSEISISRGDKQEFKGYVEAALSRAHTGEDREYPLRLLLKPFTLHGEKVDAAFLIDALYGFYVPKYREEYRKFYRNGASEKVPRALVPVNRAVASLKTNEAVVRVGHYSHVECVTLDDVRNPRTRLGKDGKFLPWGTTRTLANGLLPFGWVKITFPDLPAEPRPTITDWPFPVNKEDPPPLFVVPKDTLAELPPAQAPKSTTPAADAKPAGQKPPEKPPKPAETPLSAFHRRLEALRDTEIMSRIAELLKDIEALETPEQQAKAAAAVNQRIPKKTLKKKKDIKEKLEKFINP